LTLQGPEEGYEMSPRSQTSPSIGSLSEMAGSVERKLSEYPVVVKLSALLEIRPLLVVALAVAISFLFLGFLSQTISYLVGYVHPAWMSFKAIERKSADESRQWLTYWAVFSSITFLEMFGDIFLFWIPFYYILKVVFVLWLSLPQFRGAEFLYEQFIRRFLLEYGDKFDFVGKRGAEETRSSANN